MNSSFSLHSVYGDHMVLQRDKPIRIAGTASVGSHVTVSFLCRSAEAVADARGEWVVEFPPAKAGGPYDLVVTHPAHHSARIVLSDVMVGDVWFCSGQSNMEFPVWGPNPFFRLRDGKEVAAAANDVDLRLFQSPLCVEPDGPCTEPPGRPVWKQATTAEAVGEFSAVGYWFGKTIRKALDEKVAIGLINSSWGGTRIEPWISEETLKEAGRTGDLTILATARALRDVSESEREEVRRKFAAEAFVPLKTWVAERFLVSDPAATAAALATWALPGIDREGWSPVSDGIRSIPRPSVVWFRCEFELPEEAVGKEVHVLIGSVNDCDETFLDGVKIGETGCDVPSYWLAPRNYATILRPAASGRHVLAIRAMDHFSTGGVSDTVTVGYEIDGTSRTLDLSQAEWLRRTEFVADIDRIGLRPNVPSVGVDVRLDCQTPSTLFNSMVNPYRSLAFKGVLWYQGCSNSGDPADYLVLQRLWLRDWRRAFRDDDLPFLVTQLAAYNGHHPGERSPDDFWAEEKPGENLGFAPLREVQDAFSEERGVGLACAIDIGDHSDIHPANKKDVGIRLAHEAMRLAYGDASALPGPRLDRVEREGGALRVHVRDAGEGLYVRGDAIGPHLFAVAGADRKFVWADASLESDGTFLVSSPAVPEPVHVQYAFSAFPPDPNLYRKGDDAPLFPFRTDLPEYVTGR